MGYSAADESAAQLADTSATQPNGTCAGRGLAVRGPAARGLTTRALAALALAARTFGRNIGGDQQSLVVAAVGKISPKRRVPRLAYPFPNTRHLGRRRHRRVLERYWIWSYFCPTMKICVSYLGWRWWWWRRQNHWTVVGGTLPVPQPSSCSPLE